MDEVRAIGKALIIFLYVVGKAYIISIHVICMTKFCMMKML